MNIRIFFSRLVSLGGLFLGINALYYIYQFVLNHGLSVAVYGGMSSLIAWTVLASIPSIALSTLLTRYVTLYQADRQKQQNFVHSLFLGVVRIILYSTPIAILMGKWIAPYMTLSWVGYSGVIFTAIAMIFVGFFRAIAYIDGRLSLYTWSTISEIGIRIICSYVAIYFTQDISILYVIYFLSIVIALVFFLPDIRRAWVGTGEWHLTPRETRDMKKSIIPMIFLSCFLISIGSTELVLARRILSSEDLGYFSALIMLAKLVMAGLGIWTAVGMPYFSDTLKHRGVLLGVYTGFVFTTGIAYIVFFFGGWRIVDAIFPAGYGVINPYILPMILYSIVVSFMGLVIQHTVISGHKMAGYLSIIIPIFVIFSFFFADGTLISVVWTTIFGYSFGAAIWLLYFMIVSIKSIYVKKVGNLHR